MLRLSLSLFFIRISSGITNFNWLDYHDYQLSEVGDEVLALKLRCCHGEISSFPTATML